MATTFIALLILVPPAHVLAADASMLSSVTPLQKVTAMLQEMLGKAKADKKAEEVEISKFSTWCAESNEASVKDISRSADSIEQLSADIAKDNSDASVLAEEIGDTETIVNSDE